MSNKGSFVFLHYENPTKDSKKLENRQKVAKYAMLGRQKNTSTKPAATPAAAPLHIPPINGQSNAAMAIPSDGDPVTAWDQHGDNLSHLQPSMSRNSHVSSNGGTAPSHFPSNTSISPPATTASADILWATSDSLPHDSSSSGLVDDPVYGWVPPPPFGSMPQTNTGDFYSSFPNTDEDLPVRPRGRIVAVDESQPDPGPFKQRPNKQRAKKQAKLTHSASVTSESSSDALDFAVTRFSQNGSVYDVGPRSLLSATPSDPFNALPIKANAHTHELLYQYMNARLISSVYANGSPDTFDRIKTMRHRVWGPLTWKSKASLNALVAYVESTPGLPIKSRSQDFLFSHVTAAMEGVREALSKPQVATDDSICFAVVLLMLTAQRTGNSKTYAAHAAGLATLLSFRTDAIKEHGETDDTVERLRSFYISDPRDQCNYCRNNQDAAGSPPRNYATDEDAFNSSAECRGLALRDLLARGLLSPAMVSFIEPAMIWSTLAERARKDKLSAAIGATHAWIDEGEFSLKGPIHYLDTACHVSVRLCFYLSSWLDWQHSCSAVRRLAKAVHTSLQHAAIEMLLVECPNALLWMSLMAGPLCDDEPRVWFSVLLARARANLGLQLWGFQDQVDTFGTEFVWSSTLTQGAEQFWNESFYPEMDFTQPLTTQSRFQPHHQQIWEL